MSWIRSCARWLAAAWLVAQIAVVVMTAGALGAQPVRETKSGHCECPGNPETAMCPMHSRKAPQSHHDCAMRQASTPSVAMLSVAPAFPVPPEATTLAPSKGESAIPLTVSDRHDRAIRPESPPPRA